VLYPFMRGAAFTVLRAGFHFRAVGLENVPSSGPAILAANHMSFLDPPVVGAPLRRELHFMAKAELFRVPGLGGVIRRLNAHPVDRSGSDSGALRLAIRLLEDGQALLLFPEGTRGTRETLRHAQAGTGMLAALSEAPVVPVYIEGTARALPRGAVCPRPARITVTYGSPVRFARERGKSRYQAISDEIMAAIGRLQTSGVTEAGRDGSRPGPPDRARSARTTREPCSAGQIQ
jgi:1-acyl-sn-glycerol-3-phosphate acyltransferase